MRGNRAARNGGVWAPREWTALRPSIRMAGDWEGQNTNRVYSRSLQCEHHRADIITCNVDVVRENS